MCSKQNRRFKSMCFNMITETNESKKLKKNIYHAHVNVVLMVENVTRTKSGITTNVGARAII